MVSDSKKIIALLQSIEIRTRNAEKLGILSLGFFVALTAALLFNSLSIPNAVLKGFSVGIILMLLLSIAAREKPIMYYVKKFLKFFNNIRRQRSIMRNNASVAMPDSNEEKRLTYSNLVTVAAVLLAAILFLISSIQILSTVSKNPNSNPISSILNLIEAGLGITIALSIALILSILFRNFKRYGWSWIFLAGVLILELGFIIFFAYLVNLAL